MEELRRPGGELASRPLHFFWIVDCSGSMYGEKIGTVNNAIQTCIPEMASAAENNPNAQLLIRTLSFSTGATWLTANPVPVEDYAWEDLDANGVPLWGVIVDIFNDEDLRTLKRNRKLSWLAKEIATEAYRDLKNFLNNNFDLETLDWKDLVLPMDAFFLRQKSLSWTERNKLNKYYKLLHSLSGNLANGIISKEDYSLLREKYQEEIKNLEANIEKQEEYIEDLLNNKLMCEEWVDAFLEKPSLGDLDRDMLLQYIEKIKVYEDKKIEIVYRFQDELVVAARLAEQIGKTKKEVAV